MPTVICDLDGVVYLGDELIPGSGEALSRLAAAGWAIVFCTNNSTRSPDAAAAKIRRVSGYEAHPDQVVTSALSAASLVEPGSSVFVLAGPGVEMALKERGCRTTSADWRNVDTVVVGLDPELSYPRLSGAVLAINAGARFLATNHDPTYPTPDGLRPGSGSLVAAVQTATGIEPEVAGKPHLPMRRLLASKAGSGPVWIVGDRDDTDLAMGRAEGWNTAHVRTGVAASTSSPPTLEAGSLAEVADHLLR